MLTDEDESIDYALDELAELTHAYPVSRRRRRRQLASELKRLRQSAKLTIEHVAETLEWSPGKISRIENARNSVNQRDTKRLLDIYQVPEGDEREALLGLARQSRERGWWQQYGEAVPAWFSTYVGLEASAAYIATYQGEFVPGLLQTQAYATTVHRSALMTATEEDIARQVAVRMERQARLSEPGAPQLWVVLNEAVIRRMVGDRSTMHEQMSKLVAVSSAPNVTEIAELAGGGRALRDSENPDGPKLIFTPGEWRAFTEGLRLSKPR